MALTETEERTFPEQLFTEDGYRRALSIARRYLAYESPDTLAEFEPASLVNEAFIRLSATQLNVRNEQEGHAILSRTMRSVLIDAARSRQAAKRRGKREDVSVEGIVDQLSESSVTYYELMVNEALSILRKQDRRAAAVFELVHVMGLRIEDAAAALEVSLSTAKRDLQVASASLQATLSAPPKSSRNDE